MMRLIEGHENDAERKAEYEQNPSENPHDGNDVLVVLYSLFIVHIYTWKENMSCYV